MTLLAVPVFGHFLEAIRRDMDAAIELGADLIELRLDLSEDVCDEEIRTVCRAAPDSVKLILTIRSRAEGGDWDGDDDERVSRLIELGPAFDYIDVELSTWRRSANIRRKITLALRRAGHISQAEGMEEIESAAPRALILSRHDLATRPQTLQADLLAMLDEKSCRIPKLVWRARSIRDNFEAFEMMRMCPRPAIIICLGEEGLLSRVLARKFGSFATFAALRPGGGTAPGQLTIKEMKHLYRWDEIDKDTAVYGVVGDPVRHSLGPRVHNAAFAAVGENAIYLPMPVAAGFESFKAFMVEVLGNSWLDIRGLSVTMPHKENALRFLRECGGSVDPAAERIGAVNTLILGADGSVSGHNTDHTAALETICEGLGCGRHDLADTCVAVLGAGGVARAVVAALTGAGADVTIFNRTAPRAESLAREFGCRCAPWDDRLNNQAMLLVNCTSAGQSPDVEHTPMPAASLRPEMTVFDTIYNPARTRLLREAAQRGCRTINGMAMFLLQARTQFQHWTGQSPPLDVFRRAAEAGMAASSSS